MIRAYIRLENDVVDRCELPVLPPIGAYIRVMDSKSPRLRNSPAVRPPGGEEKRGGVRMLVWGSRGGANRRNKTCSVQSTRCRRR